MASRESKSPFDRARVRWRTTGPYGRRRWKGWRRDLAVTLHPRNLRDREWWADTFGPVVCWFLGHQPYRPLHSDDDACLRCHRWMN